MRLAALLLLLCPVAYLAYRHRWHWGGTFGLEHWSLGRVAGVFAIIGCVAWTMHLSHEVLSILFSHPHRRGASVALSTFLLAGVGAGVAVFPEAASEFLPRRLRTGLGDTRGTALLGWGLILLGGIAMAFTLASLD